MILGLFLGAWGCCCGGDPTICSIVYFCWPMALTRLGHSIFRISGLALHLHHHQTPLVSSTFHLPFAAPEAVFSDGYRPSEAFIADIAGLYS
jgi:hypothetical protein